MNTPRFERIALMRERVAEIGRAVDVFREGLRETNNEQYQAFFGPILDRIRLIVANEGHEIMTALADDLANARSALRRLPLPDLDPDLDQPTPSLWRLRGDRGNLVEALDNALDAGRMLALEPRLTELSIGEAQDIQIKRQDFARQLIQLDERLRVVQQTLGELREEADRADAKPEYSGQVSQRALLNTHIQALSVEVSAARFETRVGTQPGIPLRTDLLSLARAIEAMRDIAEDLKETVQGLKVWIAASVRAAGSLVAQSVDRSWRGMRTVASIVRRRVVAGDALIQHYSDDDATKQHYTCFISYSTKDDGFVRQLHADLQGKGVRCLSTPEDFRAGDSIIGALDDAAIRRLRDKVLLVISEASIGSGWIEDEVAKVFAEERLHGQSVLLPISIDDAVLPTNKGWVGQLLLTRNVGNFRDWIDHDAYLEAFERLLRDLGGQPKANQQGHFTENVSKAVEQLASDRLEERIGGIHTLERISRESLDDYWTVIEALCTFVRARAPWKRSITESRSSPPTDIAAALEVVVRRDRQALQRESDNRWRLDFRNVDLRGANLSRANLSGANLSGANLSGASLGGASLREADLSWANLSGANLSGANLSGANLSWANLFSADLADASLFSAHLREADLSRADLRRANLGKANLSRANLSQARELLGEQLAEATGDASTQIPANLPHPAHWTDWTAAKP